MEENIDEIRLKDVILKIVYFKNLLKRNIVVILAVTFLFGVLGVVYSIFKTESFDADLTFVVDESQDSPSGLGMVSGLASQFGFNIGGSSNGTFSQANIQELLISKRVVYQAILQNGTIDSKDDLLINHFLEINEYKKSWADEMSDFSFPPNLSEFSFEHDSIMGIVYSDLINNYISTHLEEESSIFKITSSSKNEQFAKLLVESLAQKIEEYYTKFQTAKSESTLSLLSIRADSVLGELKNAEYRYASHKDSNFGVQRAKGLIDEIRLKRDVEILNIMYGEIVKNLELSKFTLINNKPLLNIIDRPNLPLEGDKISVVKAFILFSILGGFIICLYLIFRQVIRDELQ